MSTSAAYLVMPLGRPLQALDVTKDEHEKLRTIALRPKSSQAMAPRARIIVLCAQRLTNAQVASKLDVTSATVGKWRERFWLQRLEGLLDEPRVGAPRISPIVKSKRWLRKRWKLCQPTARTGARA